MTKKFDLSKLRKPAAQEKFLKPIEKITPQAPSKKEVKENGGEKQDKEKSVKMGRPIVAEEPLTEKVSVNLTNTEMQKLKEKIGLIPAAAYLRNALKEKGVI